MFPKSGIRNMTKNICESCHHGKDFHGVRAKECKFVVAVTRYDTGEETDIQCRCVKFIE